MPSLAAALLALLLPGPLRAEDGLAGLIRQSGPESAQAAVKALPQAAQLELFTLYGRYNELVSRRVEEGWHSGLLSDEATKVTQDDTLPARQLEEAVRSRETRIKALDKLLEKPDPATVAKLRQEREDAGMRLQKLRGALARAKGTCLDWSDQVWAELSHAQAEEWSVSDRERSIRPFHTGAVLCSPSDEPETCSDGAPNSCAGAGRVCLVFDPWQRGQADVYEFRDWDRSEYARRVPADFFLHELPEPRPARRTKVRR